MEIGDKFKIIENIEDHIGYQIGRELTIKSIEFNDYITAEEGDWYIGIEETDIYN
jgi:hypothetical protein